MIQFFIDLFGGAHGWLFEHVVEPFIFFSGLGEFTEEAFEGTEWFLVGMVELAALYLVLRPLEALLPVHAFADKRARWNDFIYTLVHRLGLFSIAIFFTLDPLMDHIAGLLRLEGVHPFNLESLLPSMPPLASFLLYLVVLDFCDYWFHRAQHHFNWWWGLHSLHHSQRDMNLWSDNRNHLLDDLLRDIVMAHRRAGDRRAARPVHPAGVGVARAAKPAARQRADPFRPLRRTAAGVAALSPHPPRDRRRP